MIEVQLWNRDLTLSDAQVTRLQDYILDRLAQEDRFSRGKCGGLAVTYLVSEIRSDTRLAFPTRMVDAEKLFKALGFTLSHEGRATYVTL